MASLKDKYCIVGVGETEYSRQSGRSTRAMAVEAVGNAMRDAGLGKDGVDGMMSYQSGDSVFANWVAPDLGMRLNFYMDVFGGGSSTEALIGLAMGAIEAGMCHTVAIFRSMNGYSDFRIGGTGARAAQPVRGMDLAQVPFGMRSAGQNFAPTFMRHMYEYGTTSEQVAHVRVAHSKHASQNPKALLKDRVTVAIAARRDRLGPLRRSAARPRFALALERLIDELQAAGVWPAEVEASAATLEGSAYLSDLATLYGGYEEARRRTGRTDAHGIAREAIAQLRGDGSFWGERPVLLYGFDDLTEN